MHARRHARQETHGDTRRRDRNGSISNERRQAGENPVFFVSCLLGWFLPLYFSSIVFTCISGRIFQRLQAFQNGQKSPYNERKPDHMTGVSSRTPVKPPEALFPIPAGCIPGRQTDRKTRIRCRSYGYTVIGSGNPFQYDENHQKHDKISVINPYFIQVLHIFYQHSKKLLKRSVRFV